MSTSVPATATTLSNTATPSRHHAHHHHHHHHDAMRCDGDDGRGGGGVCESFAVANTNTNTNSTTVLPPFCGAVADEVMSPLFTNDTSNQGGENALTMAIVAGSSCGGLEDGGGRGDTCRNPFEVSVRDQLMDYCRISRVDDSEQRGSITEGTAADRASRRGGGNAANNMSVSEGSMRILNLSGRKIPRDPLEVSAGNSSCVVFSGNCFISPRPLQHEKGGERPNDRGGKAYSPPPRLLGRSAPTTRRGNTSRRGGRGGQVLGAEDDFSGSFLSPFGDAMSRIGTNADGNLLRMSCYRRGE